MKIIKIFLGTLILAACSKADQVGPTIKSVSKDFNPSQVVITNDPVMDSENSLETTISASWGEEVNYRVIVKGLESNAERIYTGIGSSFDVEWDGLSTEIPFFRNNEKAIIIVDLLGTDEIQGTDTIDIQSSYNFDGKEVDGVKYFVLDNFEKVGSEAATLPFGQSSPDGADQDVFFLFTDEKVVDGDTALYLTGTDVNRNTWLGDFYHEYLGALLESETQDYVIDSGIEPENLWFNAYIYGTGAEGTRIGFRISEIDGGDTLNTQDEINDWILNGPDATPDDGSPYRQSDNDAYVYNVQVDWQGWKLVSLPYSDFTQGETPGSGANGDGKKETFRISGVTIVLESYPEGGLTPSAYMDFVTITQGGKANYFN